MPGATSTGSCVSQQDGVELFLWAGGWAIEGFCFLAALEQAAVHENTGGFGLDIISRAGDFAAAAPTMVIFMLKGRW